VTRKFPEDDGITLFTLRKRKIKKIYARFDNLASADAEKNIAAPATNTRPHHQTLPLH
jgi:hypothetical protein